MNDWPDAQLLRAYAESRSEAAFNELVRRHVDLVYSAARRMVCDPHLAQDVTQGVFVALAKNASQLLNRPVLSGWLHHTAQNIAAQTVRTIERRRAREQKATAMNELLSAEPDASWEEIAPHLDAALGELNEPDRNAILLRYFERKSARQMAATLGISDEAAQKRVYRAVEHLRKLFAKRGITVGTSGLAVVISANAVQAAPTGLVTIISTSAALAGTTITSTATAMIIKAIAMTTLQKTLATATVALLVGAAIYEAHKASVVRAELKNLQQQPAERRQQLEREYDEAAAKQAALLAENDRLKSNATETLKLRQEVARLRLSSPPAASVPTAAASPSGVTELPKDSWADAGFATPQEALRTRGWSVLNGNRERFKESIFITDGARKTLEDMFVRLAEGSNDPNKAQLLQEVLNQKLGVEEGILMPMMAENETKGYTGYRVLSEKSPSADEAILEVATQMASAPAKTETLKLRRFGSDWKVVIDEDFIKSPH